MAKKDYLITSSEFGKISKWAENVYNIIIIIDYFVENQPHIEELNNLAPVIKALKNESDLLYSYFIDKHEERNLSES